MEVGISILVENTTPSPSLIGEYGFAALITVDSRKILFDTGSSDALFKNSSVLGVRLEEVESLVLSHGHYDHTGAVIPLLRDYGSKRIYCHPGIFAKRPMPGNREKNIGCVFTRQEALDAGAEFVFTNDFSEIYPGVFISGEIPRITDFEDVGGNFEIEAEGKLIKDRLIDDMALIINHPEGLIIVSGCGHSGIINIIKHARQKTGRTELLAFIGGTHLINASRERMSKTVAALKLCNIKNLVVSHCTGFYSAAMLYNELGSKVIKGETGMTFKF